MGSVINSVLTGGREKIGLTGDFNGKKTTVDINVTTAYTWVSGVDITSHPIEKDDENLNVNITDHVVPKLPVISIEAILSDDLNLLSSVIDSVSNLSVQNNAVSVKDKIKILAYWQRTGALLTMEGYFVGGVGSKILNYFKSGVGALISSEDIKEAFYAGISTDNIKGVVLGNITYKQTLSNGLDVVTNFSLQKVYYATAKIGSSSTGKSKPGVTDSGKRETVKKPDLQIKNSKIMDLTKGVKK